ncbi:MAG: phosphoenolpyruvate carboxylase [Patescibacteria group bacterium]|nr:phosphoenolpyruvate carboxylase [Patescibacteria group bacterium]
MQRHIPATMATQHPDNANAPYWERDGDGFVSAYEELDECVSSFRDLGVSEFMWDWEGKFADEAVVDRLFAKYYGHFKKRNLGRDEFLTFRIPNVSHEPGYSLMRALMVILTAEDFAGDLKFHSPPLFEVILPMAESPRQLLYIQDAFEKLAKFKAKTFTHHKSRHREYLEVIPLFEGVDNQTAVREFLEEYVSLHRKRFGTRPAYLRPFLARSDPALVSGVAANVLANKVALSDIAEFSRKQKVPCFPIIGTGSLPFRGGLSPLAIKEFLREYGGIRTVTIQSAFRYDFPLPSVKAAVKHLSRELPKTQTQILSVDDRHTAVGLVKKFSATYQVTLKKLLPDLPEFFAAVPRRRERHLHIGLLAYKRAAGKLSLPRAITFTAAFYSLGVPPEFLGFGRTLAKLSPPELAVLFKYYRNLKFDLDRAGRYLNRGNLLELSRKNRGWRQVAQDISELERILKMKFGPRTEREKLHVHLSSNLLIERRRPHEVARLIAETGKLRRSLG